MEKRRGNPRVAAPFLSFDGQDAAGRVAGDGGRGYSSVAAWNWSGYLPLNGA